MARKWKRTTTSPWLGGSASNRPERWINSASSRPERWINSASNRPERWINSAASRTERWITKRARNPRIAGSLYVLSAYDLEAVQDALAVGALHQFHPTSQTHG
jgi:hypothetical protein